MHIDQAGHERARAEIDNLSARRNRIAAFAHGNDPAVGHNHLHIINRATGNDIEHVGGTNDHCLCRRRACRQHQPDRDHPTCLAHPSTPEFCSQFAGTRISRWQAAADRIPSTNTRRLRASACHRKTGAAATITARARQSVVAGQGFDDIVEPRRIAERNDMAIGPGVERLAVPIGHRAARAFYHRHERGPIVEL